MRSTSCTTKPSPAKQSQHSILGYFAAPQRSHRALCSQVYTNFEPRIGLAWNPDFDKKLVVSAGYAINANPAFYNIVSARRRWSAGDEPRRFSLRLQCLPPFRRLNPERGLSRAQLAILPTGGDPGQDVEDTFPPNFRTPYVQTWTLGIDHQIGNAAVGEVRYVGSKTTDDFQSIDANPFLLPVASAFPKFYSACRFAPTLQPMDTDAPIATTGI